MMKQYNVLGIIPSRLGSTRLERKALKDIAGKPLVQRVWEGASKAKRLTKLAVATDSSEIESIAKNCGAEVVMTSTELGTGSERVAVASKMLKPASGQAWDAVVNIQGDMPFISGEVIDGVIEFLLEQSPNAAMATVAAPMFDEEAYLSPNVVKVALSEHNQALYFSRAPIPFSRDGNRLSWNGQTIFAYKHIGLYAFRPRGLEPYFSDKAAVTEQLEKLEQLRLLEAGEHISVQILDPAVVRSFVEVDTAADLLRANSVAKS